MKKLAIVITHPIQYFAPWFKVLNAQPGVNIKVFYTWSQSQYGVKDKVFGKTIQWDIPLLEGYSYEFIENVSKSPGTHHKNGIQNPNLIQAIENWESDVLLVFGWYFKSHFEAMKHFKGKIPVWFRGDSTLLDEKRGLKRYFRRLYLTYVYRHIDMAFYAGTENKKYFKVHGLKESQLVFAPNAIDNERFNDSRDKNHEIKAREWRRQLGYFEEDIVVLFAGKFDKVKQPKLIIRAIQRINMEKNKDLKLLLVGNGPMEKELEILAQGDDNIQILPFQNQSRMPLVYRLGNICCLPSKSETWGLAVNEAMASGRGVIVSNKVGCATDLVKQELNGYIFNYNDISDLESCLGKLTLDGCKLMGTEAHKSIQTWNFGNVIDAIMKSF